MLSELKEDIIRERILSSNEFKSKGKIWQRNELRMKMVLGDMLFDGTSEARDLLESDFMGNGQKR